MQYFQLHFLKESIGFYGLNILKNIYDKSANIQIEIKAFKLLFDSILCYYIVHYQIHNHHYLSIVTLLIGISIVTSEEIVNEQCDIFIPFILFGHSLILTICDCIEKVIMEKKFMSPTLILFFRGLFGSSMVIRGIVISQFVSCVGDVIYLCEKIVVSISMMFESRLPLYFAIYFFSGPAYNLFAILTKKDYTPAYMSVGDYFCTIIWKIVSYPDYSTMEALSIALTV